MNEWVHRLITVNYINSMITETGRGREEEKRGGEKGIYYPSIYIY